MPIRCAGEHRPRGLGPGGQPRCGPGTLADGRLGRAALLQVPARAGRSCPPTCCQCFPGGLLTEHCGRDRSDRAYLAEALAGSPFSLSEACISRNARHLSHCCAADREPDGEFRGYLGVDFGLREPSAIPSLYEQAGQWMQHQGDPAMRAGLFQQERVANPMDERIDEGLDPLAELITVHGVFHAKLRFSSSRATLCPLDDPYRFRIRGISELAGAGGIVRMTP